MAPYWGISELKQTLLGPLAARKRPATMSPAQAQQPVAVGTKSGSRGPSESLQEPQKGYLGPKRAILGPLRANKRPNNRSKCVVTMSPAQPHQPKGVGTKNGPCGPTEDLQDLKKGHFGPKRVLYGPLVAKNRPNTRPKCVVTMTPTHSDQSAAIGTKSGPKSGPQSFSPS